MLSAIRPKAMLIRSICMDLLFFLLHKRVFLQLQYDPDIFSYYITETDYSLVYYDSSKLFLGNVICADEGEFEAVLREQYEIYLNSGTGFLRLIRDEEWEKVIVQGNRKPN